MITIKDFMECVDYRITEGSEYLWSSFGPNAHSLDCWNGEHNGFSIGIVFDTKNTTVYKFEAHDYSKENSYRWIHPNFKEAYFAEGKNKNIDLKEAYDHVNFIDIDVAEDMIQKATHIVMGIDYDERIQVPLDLPETLMNKLFRLAHDQDITLNVLVENILKEELNIQ